MIILSVNESNSPIKKQRFFSDQIKQKQEPTGGTFQIQTKQNQKDLQKEKAKTDDFTGEFYQIFKKG